MSQIVFLHFLRRIDTYFSDLDSTLRVKNLRRSTPVIQSFRGACLFFQTLNFNNLAKP